MDRSKTSGPQPPAPRRVLLAVLVGLAAFGAVWVVWPEIEPPEVSGFAGTSRGRGNLAALETKTPPRQPPPSASGSEGGANEADDSGSTGAASGTVQGWVEDDEGNRLDGATIELRPEEKTRWDRSAPRDRLFTRSGGDGTYRVTGVVPGKYAVLLDPSGGRRGAPGEVQLYCGVVEVLGGRASRFPIELPGGRKITGNVFITDREGLWPRHLPYQGMKLAKGSSVWIELREKNSGALCGLGALAMWDPKDQDPRSSRSLGPREVCLDESPGYFEFRGLAPGAYELLVSEDVASPEDLVRLRVHRFTIDVTGNDATGLRFVLDLQDLVRTTVGPSKKPEDKPILVSEATSPEPSRGKNEDRKVWRTPIENAMSQVFDELCEQIEKAKRGGDAQTLEDLREFYAVLAELEDIRSFEDCMGRMARVRRELEERGRPMDARMIERIRRLEEAMRKSR